MLSSVVSLAVVLSLPAVGMATAGPRATPAVSGSLDGTVPEWSPEAEYNGGDQVTYGGSLWRAGWWTRGQVPGDPHGPWQEIVTTPEGEAVWTPSRAFDAGDVAVHEGIHYVAQWYTRNQLPTVADGPWRAQRSPEVPGSPAEWSSAYEYSTGDLARHDGHLWVALWWAGHQEPGVLDGPWGEIAVTPQGEAVWTPTRVFDTGDTAVYEGAEYTAKWWTRNQVPGDPNGPWRLTADAVPSGARTWSPDIVFAAGDVAVHGEGQYVATQASRAAEPGDPAAPWAIVPGGVTLTAPPTIAGTAEVGRTVRGRAGTWADPDLTFTYRWFAGRRAIGQAQGRTLRVPPSVRGRLLRVVVTAHRQDAYVGSAASRPVKVRGRLHG